MPSPINIPHSEPLDSILQIVAISSKFAKTNVQPFIAMVALPAAFGGDNIQIDHLRRDESRY